MRPMEVDSSPPFTTPTTSSAQRSVFSASTSVIAAPTPPSSLDYRDHDPALDSGDESDSSEASVATTVFQKAVEVVKKKMKEYTRASKVSTPSPLTPSTTASVQGSDCRSQSSDAPSNRTKRSASVVASSPFSAMSSSALPYHRRDKASGPRLKRPSSAPTLSSAHVAAPSRISMPPLRRLSNLKGSNGPSSGIPSQKQHFSSAAWEDGESSVSAFSKYSSPAASSVSASRAPSRAVQKDSQSSILYARYFDQLPRRTTEGDAESCLSSLRLRQPLSCTAEEDARSSISTVASISQYTGTFEVDARSSVSTLKPAESEEDKEDTQSSVASTAMTPGLAKSSLSSMRRLQSVPSRFPSHSRKDMKDAGSNWQTFCIWSKYFVLFIMLGWFTYKVAVTNTYDVNICSGTLSFPLEGLSSNLSKKVYGQELPISIITAQMQKYMNQRMDHRTKPLVLSFHGWSGVGKTFMSKQIISFFDPNQVKYSAYFKDHFDFMKPNGTLEEHIRVTLLRDLSMCHLNIFTLEEVDLYTVEIIQGVIATMKTITNNPGLPWPPVVFILIPTMSNGGYTIMEHYLQQVALGKRRDMFTQEEFADAILKEKVNWSQLLTMGGLLDSVVPFLPLEEEHVVECIRAECLRRDHHCTLTEVKHILGKIDFKLIPNANLSLPLRGCYRVQKAVIEYVYRPVLPGADVNIH